MLERIDPRWKSGSREAGPRVGCRNSSEKAVNGKDQSGENENQDDDDFFHEPKTPGGRNPPTINEGR
jgi:hypothetical protein